MEKVDIQQVFAVIAGKNPVLGNPQGEKAYGYTRVSSAGQAEEGASGLPRQIEHVHKAAIRDNLYIPVDLLYVDDGYSGFEFVERPALTRLRYDMRTKKQASHLVVEEIDRLSRNADWHQGFLLNEFTRQKVKVHFYNEPGSEIERYLRGYMAQESMRKELERMQLGRVYKAMDGRVTAVRSAYGYDISDPKDSHYVINEE
ncbi:MAG TPA: recombinase family protein [Caldilineaceae bacterium]|nr:recombinase family protein [Caldilineaceae bacterium]